MKTREFRVQAGVVAAGALALAALLLFWRKSPEPEKPPVRPAPETVLPAPSPSPVAVRPAPGLPGFSAPVPFGATPPKDVLQGSFEVEARAEAPIEELVLTESQRPLVLAFLAARDATLQEIRATVEGRRPAAEEVDRLCARAQEAQASCMASIRATLLPDQAERFDALVRSGRWGGFTLTIQR